MTVDDVTAVGRQAVMVVNSELLELTLSSKSGKSKSTFQPTDIVTTVKIQYCVKIFRYLRTFPYHNTC